MLRALEYATCHDLWKKNVCKNTPLGEIKIQMSIDIQENLSSQTSIFLVQMAFMERVILAFWCSRGLKCFVIDPAPSLLHVNNRDGLSCYHDDFQLLCRHWRQSWHIRFHYNNVIMSAMVVQITDTSIVCLTVCSGADQRKHQSSASLAIVRRIHRRPVDSPHKGPVMRRIFWFDDVIMFQSSQ